MKRSIRQRLSAIMALVMFTVFSVPQAGAREHIVSLTELQGQLRSAADNRAKNLEDIQRVLSHPAAVAALKKSNVTTEQAREAVATLSDAELTRLSNRARAAEKVKNSGKK